MVVGIYPSLQRCIADNQQSPRTDYACVQLTSLSNCKIHFADYNTLRTSADTDTMCLFCADIFYGRPLEITGGYRPTLKAKEIGKIMAKTLANPGNF